MIIRHILPGHEVAEKAADFIFNSLEKFLEEGPSLFLVSGGSVAHDVAPGVFKKLKQLPKSSLTKLHVALVDERYGKPWHKESNMRLLREVGIIDQIKNSGVRLCWPLVESDKSTIDVVSRNYNTQLIKLFSICGKRSLGVFGVGSDGHTAGIKPLSMLTFKKLFGGNEIAVGYRAADYPRITLTPVGISRLNMVVIYAIGEEKQVALWRMQTGSIEQAYRYPAVLFQSHPQAHLFAEARVG